MQLPEINNANILNEYILILICLKLTILTYLQDEISSDRVDLFGSRGSRQMFVCVLHTEYKQLSACTGRSSLCHTISQHFSLI
jgi:hypothetical protein